MADKIKRGKWAGVMAICGGFLLHLTLGTLYCFGNMNTYMTSYLRTHVPGQEHKQYSDAIWIPTLATLGQGGFMTFAGHLEERLGVRTTVLLGCSIMSSGVFLTYYTIQYSMFLTTLTYGFMFGLGIALAYAPPMAVAMKWFPRKKGLVNGIIVGGFGLGAFIFNTVQTTYLNPSNQSPDADGYFSLKQKEVLDRVPSVFLLLGSIYTVMQLLAVMMITSPSEDDMEGNIPLVTSAADVHNDEHDEDILYQNDAAVSSPRATNVQDHEIHIEPGQIVRTIEFWILWTTFVLNTQAVGYINSMYKAFGQTFIKDDHFLAVVGAFAAIFNSGGRVMWGHLCDVFGYKMCMMLVTSLITLLFSTLYLTEFGSRVTYAVWIWAIFFSFCGNFVLLPTATAQCFGTKSSSKNYGLVMTGSAVASPLIALLTQFLSPIVGFLGLFIIIALFSAAAGVLTLLFPGCPSPKKIQEKLQPAPEQL